jgi:hypothetical protein
MYLINIYSYIFLIFNFNFQAMSDNLFEISDDEKVPDSQQNLFVDSSDEDTREMRQITDSDVDNEPEIKDDEKLNNEAMVTDEDDVVTSETSQIIEDSKNLEVEEAAQILIDLVPILQTGEGDGINEIKFYIHKLFVNAVGEVELPPFQKNESEYYKTYKTLADKILNSGNTAQILQLVNSKADMTLEDLMSINLSSTYENILDYLKKIPFTDNFTGKFDQVIYNYIKAASDDPDQLNIYINAIPFLMLLVLLGQTAINDYTEIKVGDLVVALFGFLVPDFDVLGSANIERYTELYGKDEKILKVLRDHLSDKFLKQVGKHMDKPITKKFHPIFELKTEDDVSQFLTEALITFSSEDDVLEFKNEEHVSSDNSSIHQIFCEELFCANVIKRYTNGETKRLVTLYTFSKANAIMARLFFLTDENNENNFSKKEVLVKEYSIMKDELQADILSSSVQESGQNVPVSKVNLDLGSYKDKISNSLGIEKLLVGDWSNLSNFGIYLNTNIVHKTIKSLKALEVSAVDEKNQEEVKAREKEVSSLIKKVYSYKSVFIRDLKKLLCAYICENNDIKSFSSVWKSRFDGSIKKTLSPVVLLELQTIYTRLFNMSAEDVVLQGAEIYSTSLSKMLNISIDSALWSGKTMLHHLSNLIFESNERNNLKSNIVGTASWFRNNFGEFMQRKSDGKFHFEFPDDPAIRARVCAVYNLKPVELPDNISIFLRQKLYVIIKTNNRTPIHLFHLITIKALLDFLGIRISSEGDSNFITSASTNEVIYKPTYLKTILRKLDDLFNKETVKIGNSEVLKKSLAAIVENKGAPDSLEKQKKSKKSDEQNKFKENDEVAEGVLSNNRVKCVQIKKYYDKTDLKATLKRTNQFFEVDGKSLIPSRFKDLDKVEEYTKFQPRTKKDQDFAARKFNKSLAHVMFHVVRNELLEYSHNHVPILLIALREKFKDKIINGDNVKIKNKEEYANMNTITPTRVLVEFFADLLRYIDSEKDYRNGETFGKEDKNIPNSVRSLARNIKAYNRLFQFQFQYELELDKTVEKPTEVTDKFLVTWKVDSKDKNGSKVGAKYYQSLEKYTNTLINFTTAKEGEGHASLFDLMDKIKRLYSSPEIEELLSTKYTNENGKESPEFRGSVRQYRFHTHHDNFYELFRTFCNKVSFIHCRALQVMLYNHFMDQNDIDYIDLLEHDEKTKRAKFLSKEKDDTRVKEMKGKRKKAAPKKLTRAKAKIQELIKNNKKKQEKRKAKEKDDDNEKSKEEQKTSSKKQKIMSEKEEKKKEKKKEHKFDFVSTYMTKRNVTIEQLKTSVNQFIDRMMTEITGLQKRLEEGKMTNLTKSSEEEKINLEDIRNNIEAKTNAAMTLSKLAGEKIKQEQENPTIKIDLKKLKL